jgi:glycosyltransferase involved in cell wall biosynthesis
MPKVSICIPTYKRPELIKVAIESCLAQTYEDFEIVIVDDSPDTMTKELVATISSKQRVNYVKNPGKTSQARGVNQLFGLAQGEFLVLLHDDNLLTPNALEDLIKPLQESANVVGSFGKDYLANDDGTILDAESALLNHHFWKTDDRANTVQRSAWSILVAQFPGDGYMVRTAAAQKTLYRLDPEVGEACDADFGYRLSELGEFFFVGEHTHVYRNTKESISSSGLRIHLSRMYFLLQGRTVPQDLEGVRHTRLQQLAPVAVNGCLLTAERMSALKILLGPNYPWKEQFVKGVVQLGLAFAPRATTEVVIQRNSQRRGLAASGWLHHTTRAGAA